MTATITAINVDPGAASLAPGSMTEHTLQDFVTSLQNNGALSGMPQLANPGALASELFSNLRGFFERTRNVEREFKSMQSRSAPGDDRVQIAMTSAPDELRTPGLHGGPAREKLEPADANDDLSATMRASDAELQRLVEFLIKSRSLSNEQLFLATEVSQVSHSVNTLLRGS